MLTFAYAWIFFLAPLPVIVRWLVPAQGEARPSVRVPFLSRLEAASEGSVRVKTPRQCSAFSWRALPCGC